MCLIIFIVAFDLVVTFVTRVTFDRFLVRLFRFVVNFDRVWYLIFVFARSWLGNVVVVQVVVVVRRRRKVIRVFVRVLAVG